MGMHILDRMLHAVDSGVWQVAEWLGVSASAYCDIETTDQAHALVTADGSLLSMFELGGTGRMVGSEEFDQLVVAIARQLRAYFVTPSQHFQLVFTRDTSEDAVERQLAEMLGPSVATTRRLQLDMDDLIDEQAATLGRYCAVEKMYLVAWTTPAALSPIERRSANKERLTVRRESPEAVAAQRVGNAIAALREGHNSLIAALGHDFANLGFRIRVLPVADALRAIRSEVDPYWTAPDWQPSFPGDGTDAGRRARAAERGVAATDLSALLWPPMVEQLIPRGLTVIDGRIVKIGDRLFYPMSVSMPPANLQPFDVLFARLHDADVSYRMSWRLSAGGVDDTEIRLRSLFALLSTSKTAKAALAAASDDSKMGGKRIGLQIDVVVWSDGGDRERLLRDGARVARAIQGWGGCEVDERLGNPVGPVMATVPGLAPRGHGTLSVPPIEDAVALMPIGRPASPWANGSLLFRTPDGKLYPYVPYSREQAAWVTLIYAPMGAGKSVLAAAYNTALCMRPGLDRLPFISILDVGPSSSGMISLIREALPPDLREQVIYRRLRLDATEAINPCDTPLGMRRPLPVHRSFLINLLALLSTGINDQAPPSDIPHLAGSCVDLVYQEFADQGGRTQRYARIDGAIDSLVDAYGIHWDVHTTWWEIVDALFEAGDVHGAYLAQRFAMPKIGDIAGICRDQRIALHFTGMAPNGQPIVEYFFQAITQSVREYPLLATSTRFGLGDARIVSLDLADVAPKGGPTADRQTAVMYMLARHVLSSRFFLHQDDLATAAMPDGYRTYHWREIQQVADDPKRIFYDEFHRTSASPIVRQQVVTDIREGRKANLEVVLASQRLEDFDSEMVDLATTIFVVGVGQLTLRDTVTTFQLGAHAANVLAGLGKPTSAGARMLGIFTTTQGRYVVELMHTLSATALWAYGTTAEDRSVRDRLYRLIGPQAARQVLAKQFPGGTAKEEIERRREHMGAIGTIDSTMEEAEASLIERLVAELVEQHEAAMVGTS